MSTLTPRETELAALAWRAMKSVEIDFDKLAEIAGFKNKNSASACFGPLKKKLMAADGANASPSKGGKRGAPADGDEDPTPTKKPRARAKKAQAAPAPAPADDDENDDDLV